MKIPEWMNYKVAAAVVLVGITVAIVVSLVGSSPGGLAKVNGTGKVDGFKTVLDTSKNSFYPYDTSPINSLDQYEIDAVFENEGDRELKQTQINRITRRWPFDWTNLPPSASRFQSEQAKYIEGFSSNSDANSANLDAPYEAIGLGNLTPPDTLAMEAEEKRILAAYAPKKTQDLTTYDINDAQDLVSSIYKKRGLVPTVVRKNGNVFEVVGTRNVNEKVEYEDELPDAPTSNGPLSSVGEATLSIPATATYTAAGLDPFYEPTTKTRSDRSDYTRWTPGLERMYAPTYPTTDWINQPKDSESNQDYFDRSGPIGYYGT